MDVCAAKILERLPESSRWITHIIRAVAQPSVGLHLAVFAEPFLSRVLSGEKTIESRLNRIRCAPFGVVRDGDIILLKAVGGPICGLALAKRVWFFDLAFRSLDQVRAEFGRGICAEDEFWQSRRDAAFASLIELAEPLAISPLPCGKHDPRGWVALRSRQMTFPF